MTKFRVEERYYPREQKQHKGWNQAGVKKGQKVYYIIHRPSLMSYHYGYLRLKTAQEVCEKLEAREDLVIEFNFNYEIPKITSRLS